MPSVGKTGIDYFPYDVDLSKDPKIEYIEALHGLLGYAIYLKLLEKIYCNGYYTNWSERDIVIFAKHNTIDKDVCILIVNDCINEGLFDKKLYNDYKILTSSSIQKRYLKACERRKQINLTKEFLLLTESWINAYIKNVNVNILSLNVDILPHIETDIETDIETEKIILDNINNKYKLTPEHEIFDKINKDWHDNQVEWDDDYFIIIKKLRLVKDVDRIFKAKENTEKDFYYNKHKHLIKFLGLDGNDVKTKIEQLATMKPRDDPENTDKTKETKSIYKKWEGYDEPIHAP